MEPQLDSTSPTGGDQKFYNVMPRNVSGLPPVEPPNISSGSTRSGAPVKDNIGLAMPAAGRRKGLIILAAILGVAVIAALGWFGYRYAKQHRTQSVQTNTQPEANEQTQSNPAVSTSNDWQKRYFNNEQCQDTAVCGDSADPDRDGLSNLEEFNTKTDPNNPDSDADGLSDGDEVAIFGGSPLTDRTNSSSQYSDSDYAKGGYDVTTDQKFTDEKLTNIKNKIKTKGLHQPTIKTLGADNLKQYDFSDPSAPATAGGDNSTIDSSIDQSPTAKLNRDTQRSNTIQKIATGLTKYKQAKNSYPDTSDFNEMVTKVKPYIGVATNYADPINKDQYMYGYVASNKAQDYTLMYFSETQNQVIKYTSQQAELDQVKSDASANDDKRIRDIENIARALGIYSDAQSDTSGGQKVFPLESNYKTELVPQYLSAMPTDPRTGKDYDYSVGEKFDTFTLRAVFDNPPKGTTGYTCNQEECHNY